jgi:hypothetical protein
MEPEMIDSREKTRVQAVIKSRPSFMAGSDRSRAAAAEERVSWPHRLNGRPGQLLLTRAGEIPCAGMSIPVWQVAEEALGVPVVEGKLVRYCDMPGDIERAFREQQVLAGKPFEGVAYVEDFQLFVDLRARRHN